MHVSAMSALDMWHPFATAQRRPLEQWSSSEHLAARSMSPPAVQLQKRDRSSWGRLLHQSLNPRRNLLAQALTPSNHEHGIISSYRADDLRPAHLIERLGDRAG
jgi:hypothetical protein